MGMTKLTQTFAALADDTRFEIVERLVAGGEMAAGDLSDGFGISAPAISRHLKVLRTAGLIDQRAKGTHRYYTVRPEALRAIADWTSNHRAFWEGSLDRLDTLLALDPNEEEEA